MPIIKLSKSIIPSCDVSDLGKLKNLVKETCSVDGIGAYKIGLELVMRFGMPSVVESIKKFTNLPIIYDHQKAATDIPELGEKFAKAVKGADAVILFPFTGPETEIAWIKACKKEKLGVIVGGEMTHKCFLESEGGFISEKEVLKIYEIATKEKINDFFINRPYERVVKQPHISIISGRAKNVSPVHLIDMASPPNTAIHRNFRRK